jgi:hypothetical protein
MVHGHVAAAAGATAMTTRSTFIVHLVPTPDCTDPVKALRELLKRALRSWGLRCVTLSEINPEQEKENRNGKEVTRT